MWSFEESYAGVEDRSRDVGRITGKSKALTDKEKEVVEETFKINMGDFLALILKYAFTTSRVGSSRDRSSSISSSSSSSDSS
jgi:hypothetical protein